MEKQDEKFFYSKYPSAGQNSFKFDKANFSSEFDSGNLLSAKPSATNPYQVLYSSDSYVFHVV
jgi:hypothetical protein